MPFDKELWKHSTSRTFQQQASYAEKNVSVLAMPVQIITVAGKIKDIVLPETQQLPAFKSLKNTNSKTKRKAK